MIEITEKDVGRKVVLRNGSVATIDEFDSNDDAFPVFVSEGFWTHSNGLYSDNGPENGFDIIDFAHEPETTTTKDKLLELFDDFIAAKNYDAACKIIEVIDVIEDLDK